MVVVLFPPLRRSDALLHPFLDVPILNADAALSEPGHLRTIAAREQALQRGVRNSQNRCGVLHRSDAVPIVARVHAGLALTRFKADVVSSPALTVNNAAY